MNGAADLWQSVEHGSQLDDGPVEWNRSDMYPTTAENRRRILDRAHRNGIKPDADGWLYESRVIGSLGLDRLQLERAGLAENPTLTTWSRIRWDRTPEADAVDLDATPGVAMGVSTNRGVALLREVMTLVDREAEIMDAEPDDSEAGRWAQSHFGTVETAELRPLSDHRAGLWYEPIEVLPGQAVRESCGTTACVAGHAVLLAGDSPVVPSARMRKEHVSEWWQVVATDGAFAGTVVPVQERARDLLKLSDADAEDLFDGLNTLADVRRIANRIMLCAEKIGAGV